MGVVSKGCDGGNVGRVEAGSEQWWGKRGNVRGVGAVQGKEGSQLSSEGCWSASSASPNFHTYMFSCLPPQAPC